MKQQQQQQQVLLLILGLALAEGLDCSQSSCPNQLYSHYYAKNCSPQGYDPCCPRSFVCPPFPLDRERCHYQGRVYGLREDVPVKDPCSAGCFCRESYPPGGPAVIECADVECPSLFNPLEPNCRYTYKLGQCCEDDKLCGTPTVRGATCTHKDKVYKEGDQMFFDEHPCRKCVCGSGYTGPFGPGCETFTCGMDFRYTRQLARGCVPIYFEEGCCPISWLCPDDPRLPQPQRAAEGADCSLGQLGVNRNEVIDLDDCKLVCGCLTPPELTCNQYRSCEVARQSKLFPRNVKV